MFRFLLFDCRADCIRDTTFCFCQYSILASVAREGRTSTGELHTLLRPLRRFLDILTAARQLRAVLVVVHHVSCAAATGCEEVLFDGGGDQVGGCGCFAVGVDVSLKCEVCQMKPSN